MIPPIVYALLVGHFVADFVCQTDAMALNKSKNWYALSSHVATYIAVLAFILGVAAIVIPLPIPVLGYYGVLWFWGVNAVAHFVTDAITSRITSKLWFIDLRGIKTWAHRLDDPLDKKGVEYEFVANLRPTRHWFFVAIGFDQLIHMVTLFVTAGWWLR